MASADLPEVAPLARFKIVMLGDPGVGKTTLVKMFMYEKYEPAYRATIGIDFLSKTMYLENRTVRLQIWDTAGQERFRALIPSYIRDSSVAIVVYDVTSRASFESVSHWVEDIRSERGEDVIVMVVGNKTDLKDSRAVTLEEGQVAAARLGVMFMETSAAIGYNVRPLFKRLADSIPDPDHGANGAAAESNLTDIKLSSTPPQEARAEGDAAAGCCTG